MKFAIILLVCASSLAQVSSLPINYAAALAPRESDLIPSRLSTEHDVKNHDYIYRRNDEDEQTPTEEPPLPHSGNVQHSDNQGSSQTPAHQISPSSSNAVQPPQGPIPLQIVTAQNRVLDRMVAYVRRITNNAPIDPQAMAHMKHMALGVVAQRQLTQATTLATSSALHNPTTLPPQSVAGSSQVADPRGAAHGVTSNHPPHTAVSAQGAVSHPPMARAIEADRTPSRNWRVIASPIETENWKKTGSRLGVEAQRQATTSGTNPSALHNPTALQAQNVASSSQVAASADPHGAPVYPSKLKRKGAERTGAGKRRRSRSPPP